MENVAFEAEGAKTSACGAPTRGCNQCTRYVDVDNPWDWCLTRTMTTRAATRLHRLARLVEEETKSGWKLFFKISIFQKFFFLI